MGAYFMTDLGQEGQDLIRQPSREDRDSADRVAIETRHAGKEKKKLGSRQRPGRKVPIEGSQDRDRGMSAAVFADFVGLPEPFVQSVPVGRSPCRVHMALPCASVAATRPLFNGSPCLASEARNSSQLTGECRNDRLASTDLFAAFRVICSHARKTDRAPAVAQPPPLRRARRLPPSRLLLWNS